MTQLSVQVVADRAVDSRRLDQLAAQLAQDLRGIGRLTVRPATAAPRPGEKSSAMGQIGALVVSGLLSAATVGAIRDVIVAFVARTTARSVAIRVGDREVTIDGMSTSDLTAVTRQLHAIVPGLTETEESETEAEESESGAPQ